MSQILTTGKCGEMKLVLALEIHFRLFSMKFHTNVSNLILNKSWCPNVFNQSFFPDVAYL